MPDLKHPNTRRRRRVVHRRRHWCCTFSPPLSPDHFPPSRSISSCSRGKKTVEVSFSSPQSQQQLRPPLARRILSPGRVSPISDHPVEVTQAMHENLTHTKSLIIPSDPQISALKLTTLTNFDVRLNARGKNGESLVLELGSTVLAANSAIFGDLIASNANNSSGVCRIEVADVENLNVFRETIELMFEEDIPKKLQKLGVFRAISILEVCAGIKFSRGVTACLRYLDAVPWTEEEEEKLRESFGRFSYEDDESTGILDRLAAHDVVDSQRTMTRNLIHSVTTSSNIHARNEIKSLVTGLLGKSSVYKKNYPDLNKDIIKACELSVASLTDHLLQAYDDDDDASDSKIGKDMPLLGYLSNRINDIIWLLDILVDHQMAEEFVDLWSKQRELLKIHRSLSPMVATKMQKGLDIEALEEFIGQVLLTLPLKEQHALFMKWFHCLSKTSSDCPNLSKAFQIWWRRSLLRGSDSTSR